MKFEKGHAPWNKNKKASIKERERLSKLRVGKPSWNKKLSKEIDERVKKSGETQSRTKKRLFAEGILTPWHKGKKGVYSEESRKAMGLGHLGKKLPKETIDKMSKTRTGKKHTIEWNKNISKGHIGKSLSKENIENLSKVKKGKHYSPATEFKKGRIPSEEAIKKQSETYLKKWQNPEYREKTTKAQLKGLFKRPTSFEQKIIDLNNKYAFGFEYIGNGKLMIAGLNPDFINKEKKLLIEPHCRFFNFYNPNYEKRAEAFAKHGYRTLFLYDEDLHCRNWEEICISKITDFMEEQPHG